MATALSRSLVRSDAGWIDLLGLLAGVWTLLLLPCLAPAAQRDGCLAACCAAATLLLLVTKRPRWRANLRRAGGQLLLGLALALVSYPAWIAGIAHLGRALGLPSPPPVPPAQLSPAAWLTVVALGPVVEEMLYRGRVYPFVACRQGQLVAVVASTVPFAALHVGAWMVLVAAVAGIALGMLRAATGKVLPGIGLHAGLNLGGALFGAPAQRHPLDAPAACLAGAVALAALLWAAGAGAEMMAWQGTVSVLSPLASRELAAPVQGVATVLDNGNGVTLQTVRVLGTAPGTDVYLVTDPMAQGPAAIRLEASVGIGTFAPFDPLAAASKRQLVQKSLAIRGVMRLCFLSASCPGSIPIPLATAAGHAGVGIGGLVTFWGASSTRISVNGAAWTVRSTTVTLQTPSGVTYEIPTSGSAHGPLSFTGSTAATGGHLSLVTPIRITSNLAGLDTGAIGRLSLRLVPEPGLLLLLASGIGGLALLPRRGPPRPRDGERSGRSQKG